MADIYIMRTSLACGAVYPPERQAQIDATLNPGLRQQRLAAWQALTAGIRHSLSVNPGSLAFFTDENGVWHCRDSKICFSLTHTGGCAAAAVSAGPVGLDAEIESAVNSRPPERTRALFRRCCTKAEQEKYSPADFAALWTKKESIFKYSGEKTFSPSSIETQNYPVKSYRCGELVVSVCSRDEENRFFSLCGETILPLEAEEI